MRISFDLPEHLFRRLKACAAAEGRTLRDLVVALIERGLATSPKQIPIPVAADLPSISLGAPMAMGAADLSNASLAERAACGG
ncbi:MAG: hypothetical protein ABL896_08785 [Hylemonella sp.]